MTDEKLSDSGFVHFHRPESASKGGCYTCEKCGSLVCVKTSTAEEMAEIRKMFIAFMDHQAKTARALDRISDVGVRNLEG